MKAGDNPTILVIIGITGDLAKRKLLPAIEKIAMSGRLPAKFKIIGISRQKISVDELLDEVKGTKNFLKSHIEMYQMDLSVAAEYTALRKHLGDVSEQSAQHLFYISIPPQFSGPVIKNLGLAGFDNDPKTKLLLEKPFGSDLASAQELIRQIELHFDDSQIYRIDHYLAKEMAQNLLVFRAGNSLFKQTWNKKYIEQIEIIATEDIGIEGRVLFYEQTGALKDLVQSHLLQLASLVLMDTPQPNKLEDIPRLRLEALKQLHVPEPLGKYVKRAQYENYRKEVGNNKSNTETYVELVLESRDKRWEAVPIRIVTGKALDKKATEIKITYKNEQEYGSNQLHLRLQPDEGITFDVWTKAPGYERKLEKHYLKYTYKDIVHEFPEAYEYVFLDAIQSQHVLFTTSDEILESWRILQPVLDQWEMSSKDLVFYPKGSKGP